MVGDTAARLGSMTKEYLPIAPLIRFVDGRGGFAQVIAARYGTDLQEEVAARSWYRNWVRSMGRGSVTAAWADRFCIEVLRINPLRVWGHTWFANVPDDEEETA